MSSIKRPVVFVSYSHDSEDHKSWTRLLSESLIGNSIEVLLDQWEVGLGDDLPQFMKQIRDCDRVLVICTESYVAKANSDKGGVGFEQLIITSELVRDLGTKKFIPVVRQRSNGSEQSRPLILETRLYIDMSNDEEYENRLVELVNEIKGEQVYKKPAFPKIDIDNIGIHGVDDSRIANPENPIDLHLLAYDLARQDEILPWRKLEKKLVLKCNEKLANWASVYLNLRPSSRERLVEQSIEGLQIYSDLFSIAMGGVASKNSQYNRQFGLLDKLVKQKDNFQGTALSIRLNQYKVSGFVYHSLIGAISLYTRQPELAIMLAETKLSTNESPKPQMLCQISGLMGYTEIIGDRASDHWQFIIDIDIPLPWVIEIFGDKESYREALVAYYLLLNIHEFCLYVRNPGNRGNYKDLRFDVPLTFLFIDEHIKNSAYTLLLENIDFLLELYETTGMTNDELYSEWSSWVDCCSSMARHYNSSGGWGVSVPHGEILSRLGF